MKAISIWQPWASAIASGAKRIETRGWPTAYRGPILIHAAKERNREGLERAERSVMWRSVLAWDLDDKRSAEEFLPFGSIIAMCDLVDCRKTNAFSEYDLMQPRRREGFGIAWDEEILGDFSDGRYGFKFENLWVFNKPVAWRGRQRIFNIEVDEVIKEWSGMLPGCKPVLDVGAPFWKEEWIPIL